MTKIQFKRGLEKDLPSLSQGEPGITTDTEKVFIGSSSGNIQLVKMEDISGISANRKIKSWVALQGQLTYIFDTDSYTIGQLNLYVGGVPQIPSVNFNEDSTTQFTLLCDASEITAGLNIIAVYR